MTQPRLLGGRYELDGVVGRGGMAEVYRARDIRLDRVVAVKTLREDLARDQTFQARFRREAQSAASLNHPSIVAVYDTGEDNSTPARIPYIVMEYVDGRTLRDLLRDDRRLLPERALEITDGVLRALDYSHRNGIIHRDIKPGNVMLMRSGDVKVMDFGIARAISDTQQTMTQTAQVIGTAQYLSPEQARGERVDARSDLYSTGCLLYELLTGRPPFLGDSPVAIAYQHVRENPVPPSRLDPEIPGWADSIVLRAMAKDPAQRYQSASDMRTDIQRALSGVPVAAPRTAAYGATRRMEPGPGPTEAIPGYGYGGPDDGDTYGGYDRYGGQGRGGGRRRAALWWTLGALAVLAIVGGIAYAVFFSSGGGTAVPQVAGMTLSAAEHKISGAGFRFQVHYETSSVAKGHVISTSPSFGTLYPAGHVITLNVSKGPAKIKLQDVVGWQVATAESTLRNQGFQVTAKTKANSPKPAGTVLSETPQPGTYQQPGTKVTLVVSGGEVKVPSVIGDPPQTAKQILQNDGFTVQVVYTQGPAGSLAGAVFSQQPNAGQLAPANSQVIIYVATASTPSPSPSPTPSTPSPSPSASTLPTGRPAAQPTASPARTKHSRR
jgi:beta-lactam-binding protein with PASTA domain/tRNA A-37 threonylcarbamoyl transferase component Bud32